MKNETKDQKIWRIRLGAAKEGHDRFEKVFNLCKNEKPPCIAVGWGEIDLSQDINEIANVYRSKYGEPFKGNAKAQIERWVEMKNGDYVIAMIRPAMICAIGKIIRERYHKRDKNFKIEIKGYNDPGEVWFFNRIDVEWITNLKNDNMKVKDLNLPKDLKNKLKQPITIIGNIDDDEYNKITKCLIEF